MSTKPFESAKLWYLVVPKNEVAVHAQACSTSTTAGLAANWAGTYMNILMPDGFVPKLVTCVSDARLTSSPSSGRAALCTPAMVARLVMRLEKRILPVNLCCGVNTAKTPA
jgi:hypothetical protein